MDITPRLPAGRQIIQAYGAGGFTVSGIRHTGALLVFADSCRPWAPGLPLAWEDFGPLAEEAPRLDLLLVGTGAVQAPLDQTSRVRLRGLGLMVETMDTGAACRTFNVLLAEERRVAAALLPFP